MATNPIICDTDVIIDYWDNRQGRHRETVDIINNQIGLSNVMISAVTKIELLIGASNKFELAIINKELKRFGIISIDSIITDKVIQLINNYNLSHGLVLPDGLIAATAMMAEMPLFTYNIKDYKFISDLKLFAPSNRIT